MTLICALTINILTPEPIINERIVTKEIVVTKYDTLYVESKPYKQIIYLPSDTVYFHEIDSSYVDSLYKEFAEQVKSGNTPVVSDTQQFGKHNLYVEYRFPPQSQFKYKFYPGPDSLIKITETITNTIDHTPQLSIFFGPSFLQIQKQVDLTIVNESFIGLHAGLRVKNIGVHYTWYQNSKEFGASYYTPLQIPKIKLF